MANVGSKQPGLMAGPVTQLDRIEAKLDALLEALADEEEGEQTGEIRTLDGDVYTVPATDGLSMSRPRR